MKIIFLLGKNCKRMKLNLSIEAFDVSTAGGNWKVRNHLKREQLKLKSTLERKKTRAVSETFHRSFQLI